MTTATAKKDTSRKFIRADQLTMDARVQRVLRPAKVKQILRDGIDPDGIGIITVSRRSNREIIILDGQHRIVALREAGMGHQMVAVDIRDGLSLEDEARIFRLLNNTNRTTAYDEYAVGLVEGREEFVTINEIVENVGFRVFNQSATGVITAVSALRRVYGGTNNGDEPRPDALEDTLTVAREAWGITSEAVEGNVIQGLGITLAVYGGDIDKAALIRKLAKYPGGAAGLLGQARLLNGIRKKPVAKCVAEIIVGVYNSGRRNTLPSL